MRQAKAFFLVCAGLFLLALSYHLGARSAGAQAGSDPVTAVQTSTGNAYAPDLVATASGAVFHGLHGYLGENPTWLMVGHIATTSPIIAIHQEGSAGGAVYVSAYSAGGDYFRSSDYGVSWQLLGNVFSGPTPVQSQQTWGSVKAKYAAPAPQKQP